MKKVPFYALSIYIVSLLLSIIGFFIDSDVVVNSLPHQVFEILMLSVIIFGLFSVVFFGIYYTSQFLKNKLR
jgi:hypothetical protein